MHWVTIGLFFFHLTAPCYASYRVYELRVKEYDAYGYLRKSEVVQSTLDPYQYEHYYGGYRWFQVTLVDTWYCPGDTSHYRAYCKKPKAKARALASESSKTRVWLPYNRQPVIP